MKAKLEFQLPEDEYDFKICMAAQEMKSAILIQGSVCKIQEIV